MSLSGNPLGSVSALSLAANPAALPMIAIAAGAGVTIAAASFAYHAYKDYEDKKMRDEVTLINHLHDKHLARIFIPDNHEIKGFPAIFKFDPDKPEAGVDSMHFTDEQIEDIGKTMPRSTDILLTNYRQSIQNAILKLKDYYFSRENHKDLTSGVISYLLYILDSKCLHFEGYEYDIAYLDAITNFINAYSSVKEREKTQSFSRFAPVYSYLLNAQQDLERHRDALSLEEMIAELRDTCIAQSDQLIRCMAKIASKQDDWDLVPYVAMDELENGILRRNYIRSEIKGLIWRSDAIVTMPDSLFKEWVCSLANYYLRTINPDSDMKSRDITSPDVLFKVPAYEKIESLRTNKYRLTQIETEKFKRLDEQYKNALQYFTTCKNFMTTTLENNKENRVPKFVAIDNAVDIKIRSGMIAQLATLIHKIISLQYMSVNLLKSIKQLGEIYVKSPANFRQVFNVFNILCKDIKSGIDDFRKSLSLIQQMNKNAMKLEDQELFPEKIRSILNVAYAKISRLDRNIKEYRDRVPKDKNAPTIESVKHEMFEVAAKLSKCYSISIEPGLEDFPGIPSAPQLNTNPETSAPPVIQPVLTVNQLLNQLSSINQHLRNFKIQLPKPTPVEHDLYETMQQLRDNAAIALNQIQEPIVNNDIGHLLEEIDDIAGAMENYSKLTKTERTATAKEFSQFISEHYRTLSSYKTYNDKISKVGLFGKRTETSIKPLDQIGAELVKGLQPA